MGFHRVLSQSFKDLSQLRRRRLKNKLDKIVYFNALVVAANGVKSQGFIILSLALHLGKRSPSANNALFTRTHKPSALFKRSRLEHSAFHESKANGAARRVNDSLFAVVFTRIV